jgi:DNA-binding MarR family transcriptional regulator
MVSPAELADPLVDVRYRAPALAESGVDYGLLTRLTGFSVKLVWILGHGLLAREFADSGITPHRFSILEVIGRNPGLQQTQLAAALALSRPATTLAVDFWEERGCVERRRTAGDRRAFGVYPTPHGEAELTRLRNLVRRADAALTSSLTEAERVELQRLLEKIHR